jgi:release factor glutamine methyltransferase
MTLQESLRHGDALLRTGPHPERARADAELLLLFVACRRRASLFAHGNDVLEQEAFDCYCALLERRRAGEPVQYITGEVEFYRLPLRVTPDVLIPRPETEILVERVVEHAPLFRGPRIVDVGTGSGAIAIALAHEWPDAAITAIDVSAAVLKVAQSNAQKNDLAERIRFLEGDLLTPVSNERFEFVVSNPPYVPSADRDTLAVEVRDHEPALALFAGDDGLAVYRRLIPAAIAVLEPGGFICLEIGFGQSEAVAALLAEAGFDDVAFAPDLQGIARVATARRPSSAS